MTASWGSRVPLEFILFQDHISRNWRRADFPGLVRAADRGSLPTFNYLRKQTALLNEFRGTGTAGSAWMGEYRSHEEAERMESGRDAVHPAGALVSTVIILANIVLGS